VVPANPQTTNQMTIRRTFALLREMWKLAPTLLANPWNAFAEGRPLTGMNKFVGENVRVLKYEADMANFIFSPGAKGGLPPIDATFTTGGGAGEIDVLVTAPPLPVGWTIQAAVAAAFPAQAPDGIFTGPIVAASDNATPYAPDLTGLPAATECVAGAWLVWTKPDGTLAYSVGITDTVTSG
jgi:hypothetical protein